MPQKCSICTHEKRAEIEAALVNGAGLRDVAGRYGVSRSAAQRHQTDHLPAALVESKANRATLQSIDVMAELTECIARVKLLSDACDEWLRDPDDPARYFVGPRSEDVQVAYEVEEPAGDGKTRTVRKKAPLSELLQRVETDARTVTAVEVKHADPRELLLKSHDRLQSRLELVAKLIGQLDERPVVSITVTPQWLEMRTVIVQSLAPYPDARRTVADALSRLDKAQ